MGLLTTTLLKSTTDKLARIYGEFSYFVAPSVDLSITTGALLQAAANQLLNITVVSSDDYNVEADLNSAFYTVATKLNAAEIASGLFLTSLTALNTHYAGQSGQAGFAEYLLATNNPTGALALYSVLVDAWLQDFWTFTQGTALDAESVMHKPIHPDWRGTTYTDSKAMGQRAVGGAFADGYACDAAYGGVVPTVEVTADFSGGGAAPTVVVTGTDAQGVVITFTATVTGGNNPVSAVATTITPAVSTAAARVTVVVASLTGIVAGSVLTVNSGLVDQEVILIESINSGAVTITAVFLKNHGSGAALTGKTTYLTTPSTVGSRCRDVTGITIGITSHSAGTVRVIGAPERSAI